MNTTTQITPEKKAELDAARAAKIATSKILRRGVQSPVPFGIMDILFYNRETKETTKWTGNEEPGTGAIIMLLPCRTERDLSRYASYSIPNDWKMKFSQGQQVYPVVNAEGYISKLIPASNMGTSNAFITTKQALVQAHGEAEKELAVQAEAAGVSSSVPPAEGFETDEESPF